MASKSAHLMVGVYKFDHAGGSFEVHLRSKSRFFCPTFQAKATWYANDQDMVMIDWGKFGSYEMALVKVDDPNDPKVLEFEGSVTGKPENWRKMQLKRRFSKAEEALFDSEWNFEHTSGQFPIEFRADGFNHCARCCSRLTVPHSMRLLPAAGARPHACAPSRPSPRAPTDPRFACALRRMQSFATNSRRIRTGPSRRAPVRPTRQRCTSIGASMANTTSSSPLMVSR